MKLHWAKRSGGSEKQFHDALRVYEVQFQLLNVNYMTHWVKNLGQTDLWEQLVSDADPL